MRYATTALASTSLRRRSSGVSSILTPQNCGIRVGRRPRGSLIQRKMNSSLVFEAIFPRSGPTFRLVSKPLILWQP